MANRQDCVTRLGTRTFNELYQHVSNTNADYNDDSVEDEETLKQILYRHVNWRDLARSIAQLICCKWLMVMCVQT